MIFKMDRGVCPKLIRRVRDEDVVREGDICRVARDSIRLEGMPILKEAMEFRRRIVEELLEKKKALDEKERWMEEDLRQEEEDIRRLVCENEKKKEKVAKMNEGLEVAKRKKKLSQELAKVKKYESHIEKVKADIKSIEEDLEVYTQFEETYGIIYGGSDEDGLIMVAFRKIHPRFPEDTYYLFFSKFNADNEFKVHHAEPTFPEFGDLVKEFEKSNDIKEFYHLVCESWKRDARGGGTPRLATPGIRVSIGQKKT